ncbi:sensor histidine kinase [Nocardia nepalensis]|uniref:sensor histidine kinase n=1 Tax=Nocardia nepalensis TaxID=3375448 RepID=UPI003B68013F
MIGARRAGEHLPTEGQEARLPPLWDVYVAGGCFAGMAATVLLHGNFAGNMPLAIAALAGIALWALTLVRRVLRVQESSWQHVVFIAVPIGLFFLALSASPPAIAAIPAVYPLIFAPLPLPTALIVTTAVNVTPLSIALVVHGPQWSNLPLLVTVTLIGMIVAPVIGTMIMTSIEQRERLATVIAELETSRAATARLSREAGAIAERERLSWEIHDTLAQGFTSIVTLAQAVEAELDNDPATARNHVNMIRATARENLAEARVMVAGLTPAALGEGSLTAAIRRQCQQLSAETGIAITMCADPNLTPTAMATSVVLLRVTQGVLSNVRKHSKADAIRVELSPTTQGLRLSLSDNGVGLPHDHTDGFGMTGMKARVAQVGGNLSVSATPGGGVTVNVEVPT